MKSIAEGKWKPQKYVEIKQHSFNLWVNGGITRKIRKYPEKNGNENTTYQNLEDSVKAVLSRKFIAVNAYNKKEGQYQTKANFIP